MVVSLLLTYVHDFLNLRNVIAIIYSNYAHIILCHCKALLPKNTAEKPHKPSK